MRTAQLLILDEPTAALDARAEYEVFVRFSELMAGRMAVIISHRFSTVRMADRIVVLESGRVVEEGTHAALALMVACTRSSSRCRRPGTGKEGTAGVWGLGSGVWGLGSGVRGQVNTLRRAPRRLSRSSVGTRGAPRPRRSGLNAAVA